MKEKILISGLLSLMITVIFLVGCSAPAPSPSSAQPAPSSAVKPATELATPKPSVTASATIPAAPQKVWTLKMNHEQAPTSLYQLCGHVPWAESVEKATNGRVKIQIYPAQTLMKSQGAWEGIKSGIADITWAFTGYYPGVFDLIEMVALPFMVPNGEVGSRVAMSIYTKFPEVQKAYEGVKVLSVWTAEPHYLVSIKKSLKSLDDFKGMKFRNSGGPPMDMMKLLGGVPMLIGMPDVYLNLQKGVIDGAQCSSESYTGFRFYEVAPFVTYVPAVATVHMLVMNQDVWKDMPKEIQDQIMSVSGETASLLYGKGVFDRSHIEMPDMIKKQGFSPTYYTVPPDELAKWIQVAGKPVWDGWIKGLKSKGYTSAQQVFDEIQSLAKQYGSK
jgi:TRAP-type transport system periplasmic protein